LGAYESRVVTPAANGCPALQVRDGVEVLGRVVAELVLLVALPGNAGLLDGNSGPIDAHGIRICKEGGQLSLSFLAISQRYFPFLSVIAVFQW
jgi:hypothetical protein